MLVMKYKNEKEEKDHSIKGEDTCWLENINQTLFS